MASTICSAWRAILGSSARSKPSWLRPRRRRGKRANPRAGSRISRIRPSIPSQDATIWRNVFGIALGYEDLNDHDDLRHDPMMAVLAGKLEAWRSDCAPVAGKSTLNRLELSRLEPTRYHKISHNPVAIKRLFLDLFLEAHGRAPNEIILDLDATDDPVHGEQEGRFFHGYYDC